MGKRPKAKARRGGRGTGEDSGVSQVGADGVRPTRKVSAKGATADTAGVKPPTADPGPPPARELGKRPQRAETATGRKSDNLREYEARAGVEAAIAERAADRARWEAQGTLVAVPLGAIWAGVFEIVALVTKGDAWRLVPDERTALGEASGTILAKNLSVDVIDRYQEEIALVTALGGAIRARGKAAHEERKAKIEAARRPGTAGQGKVGPDGRVTV